MNLLMITAFATRRGHLSLRHAADRNQYRFNYPGDIIMAEAEDDWVRVSTAMSPETAATQPQKAPADAVYFVSPFNALNHSLAR